MTELSLHILDIVQNSLSAQATLIQIGIAEDEDSDKYIISITDNGKGINNEILKNVTDPYTTTRTSRRVGMGLPLFKQAAEQTGGRIEVKSEQGLGVTVTATFGLTHIDRPPLGDIAGVVALMAAANPNIDFVYRHTNGINEYCFDSREVKKALGEVSISDAVVKKYIKEMIENNLTEIRVENG